MKVSFCVPALLALLAACSDSSHGTSTPRAPDCALTHDCDGRELWSLTLTAGGEEPPFMTLAWTTLDDGMAATFFGEAGAGLDGDALISASDLPDADDPHASLYLRIAGDGRVQRHAALPSLNLVRRYVTPDEFTVGRTETVFAMEAASSLVAYDSVGHKRWSYETESGFGSFCADAQGGVILGEHTHSGSFCSGPASARLTRLKADGSTVFSRCLKAVLLARLAPLPAGGVVALASVGARANLVVPAVASADFGDGQARGVEPDGTVLVAWDAEGKIEFVTPITTPGLDTAFDQTLAVGASGDIWVLSPDRELNEQSWSRYDEHGERQASGLLELRVGSPIIVVDSAGYAIISGEHKQADETVLQKLSPAGEVVWQKAGLGSRELAVDRAGNIYAVIAGPKLTKLAP